MMGVKVRVCFCLSYLSHYLTMYSFILSVTIVVINYQQSVSFCGGS